jgi:hypothetical protein
MAVQKPAGKKKVTNKIQRCEAGEIMAKNALAVIAYWAKRSFRHHLAYIDPEEQTALSSLGGYQKSTKIPYVGEFLVARPSFGDSTAIHLSKVTIAWDAEVPGLVLIADQNRFPIKIPEC